jgi:peptide/nickel transport system substrate-binding protein
MLRPLILLLLTTAEAVSAPTAKIHLAAPVPLATYGNPYTSDDGSSVRPSLLDGLTQLQRNGTLEPALATSWALTSPTTWVFKLRADVTFHNGAPFNAESVVAALDFIKSDAAQSLFVSRDVVTIAGWRAIDPLTVEITTTRPDPILPNRMAGVMIPEPGAWAALGPEGFADAPVGTGPFRPLDWRRGTGRLALVAVPTSWRASSSVARVDITVLTDVTARLQAMLSDQTDIAVNLEPDQLDILREAGATVHILPAPHILSVALRNVRDDSTPLKDARVRRALNLAVNKELMTKAVLGGYGVVASQITTSSIPGYNPNLKPIPYDPAAAKQLLAEAGYGDGFELEIGVFSGQVPGDTSIFQMMRQDLAAVGVRATLRSLSMADMMKRLVTGQWNGLDVMPTTISSARLGDALQPIEQLSCGAPAQMFCAPELTDLISRSSLELDPARRVALMQEVVGRFHDLAPVLLLTEYVSFTGTSPRIKTYAARANGVKFESVVVED